MCTTKHFNKLILGLSEDLSWNGWSVEGVTHILRLNVVRFSYRITNCEENEQQQNQYIFWFLLLPSCNTNRFVLQFAISPERTCTIRKEG